MLKSNTQNSYYINYKKLKKLFTLSYPRKWKTTASTTLYGRAYFLSKSILRNIDVAPLYSISANFNIAAAECNIGIEFLPITDPIIIASRKVQVPL